MYIIYCISAHGKDASRYQKYDLTPIFLSECFFKCIICRKKGAKDPTWKYSFNKTKNGGNGDSEGGTFRPWRETKLSFAHL